MNKPLVFAAIDIGSNAVRLLFVNVFADNGKYIFKKGSIVRVPIRLGEDAFLDGRISIEKADMLVKSMLAFKHLISIYQPVDVMACATSAIRCAQNGTDILKRIADETGIQVESIDGSREAEIVCSNYIAEEMISNQAYLYIEVGGGSTELILLADGKRICSRSFKLGTVRILHGLIEKGDWSEIKEWLAENIVSYRPIVAIGTGGNINCVFKILRKSDGQPVTWKCLNKLHAELNCLSYDSLVMELGLRPDRADVIVPALDIYRKIMKWADISKIYVPKVGLSDGMIRRLYKKYHTRQLTSYNLKNATFVSIEDIEKVLEMSVDPILG